MIQPDLLSTRKKRAVRGKLSEAEQAAIRAAELGGKLSVITRNSLPATPGKRPSRHQFGRVSMFAGQYLYTSQPTNPHQPGTESFASLQIIHDNPGLTYEQFLAKGGSRLSLGADVRNGRAGATGRQDRLAAAGEE